MEVRLSSGTPDGWKSQHCKIKAICEQHTLIATPLMASAEPRKFSRTTLLTLPTPNSERVSARCHTVQRDHSPESTKDFLGWFLMKAIFGKLRHFSTSSTLKFPSPRLGREISQVFRSLIGSPQVYPITNFASPP